MNPSKKYLRKRGVAARYDVVERTIERMVEDGRIPFPVYLPGSRIPLWDIEGLDANDRRATARPRQATAAERLLDGAGKSPEAA